MTFRHLEILEGAEGGRDGSLLSVLDRTQTVMGARRLRAWLMRPLTALERIQDRLDAVEEFAFKATERGRLRDTLRAVHDLERLVGRVAIGTAGPRDLVALRQSLAAIPRVRLVLEPMAGAARPAAWSASSTISPTCATRWPRRWSRSRRRWPATAA